MSDLIVNANLEELILHIKSLELKMCYQYQTMVENIHTEMYAQLLETFIKDDNERDMIKNASLNFPAVQKKKDWCYKHIQSSSLVERIVAFSIVEYLFFAGSFASIFWLKKRGLMTQGLGVSNEFISRDESQHVTTAIYVYVTL
jgi:ribonucleotide reductase beta subunit family protein with ferritin-like domain